MSSGSPLAGTRKLQRRPSASQISWTKIVSSDARSRRRLNLCGAGSAVGSTGTMDARRRREDENARLGLSFAFLVGDEERRLSKWKGSSSSLSVGGEVRRSRLRDFSCFKEVGMLPLDSYCSELDDEFTSDGLRDGGCKKGMPGWGKSWDTYFSSRNSGRRRATDTGPAFSALSFWRAVSWETKFLVKEDVYGDDKREWSLYVAGIDLELRVES
jgi:hypothetical protein